MGKALNYQCRSVKLICSCLPRHSQPLLSFFLYLFTFALGFVLLLTALPWPWSVLLARLAVRSSSAVLITKVCISTFHWECLKGCN